MSALPVTSLYEKSMTEPFKREYKLGELRITQLVLDEPEFDMLCWELFGLFPEVTEDVVEMMIDNKRVPMIARGTKTAKFFDRYGIVTDRLSIVVRGPW